MPLPRAWCLWPCAGADTAQVLPSIVPVDPVSPGPSGPSSVMYRPLCRRRTGRFFSRPRQMVRAAAAAGAGHGCSFSHSPFSCHVRDSWLREVMLFSGSRDVRTVYGGSVPFRGHFTVPCYMYRSQVLKNLTELQYKSGVVGMPTSPLTVFCQPTKQGGSAAGWLDSGQPSRPVPLGCLSVHRRR